jgi:hypothetical protein
MLMRLLMSHGLQEWRDTTKWGLTVAQRKALLSITFRQLRKWNVFMNFFIMMGEWKKEKNLPRVNEYINHLDAPYKRFHQHWVGSQGGVSEFLNLPSRTSQSSEASGSPTLIFFHKHSHSSSPPIAHSFLHCTHSFISLIGIGGTLWNLASMRRNSLGTCCDSPNLLSAVD